MGGGVVSSIRTRRSTKMFERPARGRASMAILAAASLLVLGGVPLGGVLLGCAGAPRGDAAGSAEARHEGDAEAAADPTDFDARMAWWREARFGLFIHWGLYAIPAGEWNGETRHGEWIRETARIPVEVYDRFVSEFDPVKFDADAWVRMAKDAGMRYIVITSKHHDGFCLFDSKYTDFDVMSTPFGRDILKELSEACRREGIRMCWYHSIMDWHHPDYLPRRGWEAKDRPADGADFDRYVAHMKNQLRELLTHYGDIGVLWFDGEWESTWNHEYGRDLYDFVRGLQPRILVNNRVDVGREGMVGLSKSGKYAGDFGTPEQQIPPTGLPGIDWETCMTMNDHWGWNRFDRNWKSTEQLIRMLADIASKGGNLLLNVGPKADGTFPEESVERLAAIGRWMRTNGEAIHGTGASPFPDLAWGRCTTKAGAGGATRLYLHVFDWPADGKLVVPGLDNPVRGAWLLADPERGALATSRRNLDVGIDVPAAAPDPVDSVVVLEISGRPVVVEPPRIESAAPIFVQEAEVRLTSDVRNAEIRYTLDGSIPQADSTLYGRPIRCAQTTTVRATLFRGGMPLSGTAEARFERVEPRAPEPREGVEPGLEVEVFEGTWEKIPDFDAISPAKRTTGASIDLAARTRDELVGLRFRGYVAAPVDGLFAFHVDSDDGSRLRIGDAVVVDNDGLHGPTARSGLVALAAGLHPITIEYFNRSGGKVLEVSWTPPGSEERRGIPPSALFHRP